MKIADFKCFSFHILHSRGTPTTTSVTSSIILCSFYFSRPQSLAFKLFDCKSAKFRMCSCLSISKEVFVQRSLITKTNKLAKQQCKCHQRQFMKKCMWGQMKLLNFKEIEIPFLHFKLLVSINLKEYLIFFSFLGSIIHLLQPSNPASGKIQP